MPRAPRRAVLPLLATTLAFAGLILPASGSADTTPAEGSSTPSSEGGGEATGRQLAEARRHARQEARAQSSTEAPATTPSSSTPSEAEPTPRRAHGTGHRASCHVSLEASSSRVIAGATVTLSGKLQCASAADLASQPVLVFQRERATGMSEVETASTASDGSFQTAEVTVEANTLFIARAPGGQRARVAVKVAPLVTLSGPTGAQLATRTGAGAASARHNRFTFTGTVTPVAAGERVTLQREYGATDEQWHPIAFARVQEDGSFSISHGFRTPG